MKKLIILALALALPACAQTTDLTCTQLGEDYVTPTSCIDYVAGFTDDDVYATCADRISRDPCPREGLVGICTIPTEEGGAFRQHYYPPFTISLAVELCVVFDGTFEGAR